MFASDVWLLMCRVVWVCVYLNISVQTHCIWTNSISSTLQILTQFDAFFLYYLSQYKGKMCCNFLFYTSRSLSCFNFLLILLFFPSCHICDFQIEITLTIFSFSLIPGVPILYNAIVCLIFKRFMGVCARQFS